MSVRTYCSINRSLSMLVLLLVCTTTQAGVFDGGVIFLGTDDQQVDPTNTQSTVFQLNEGGWTSAFSGASNEGRVDSTGSFGFQQSATGLQFDTFSHQADIAAGGAPYQVVRSDRSSASVQIQFTLTQGTAYSVNGGWSGTGSNANLAGNTRATITNLNTLDQFYHEFAGTPGNVSSFAYNFGDAVPQVGVRTGTLGPGTYRFTWESQTVDSYTAGGGFAASAMANMQFQLGEFAAVPEPSQMLLVLLGLLAMRRRIFT